MPATCSEIFRMLRTSWPHWIWLPRAGYLPCSHRGCILRRSETHENVTALTSVAGEKKQKKTKNHTETKKQKTILSVAGTQWEHRCWFLYYIVWHLPWNRKENAKGKVIVNLLNVWVTHQRQQWTVIRHSLPFACQLGYAIGYSQTEMRGNKLYQWHPSGQLWKLLVQELYKGIKMFLETSLM